MTLLNCEIVASVVFLLIAKIVSFVGEYYRAQMFNKSGTVLTSIPEHEPDEEAKRWVPKKKHEVLKAKYKCLKKLFQIYDASVIGILPEPYEQAECVEEDRPRSRRKRSHRTKTDACAGTTEVSSGDVTAASDTEKASTIATAVMRELKMTQCSYVSTQVGSSASKYDGFMLSPASRSNITDKESEAVQVSEIGPHPIPYLMMNEKPKLTRFQCFIQRIFGLRPERCRGALRPDGHVYAASDNNIAPHYGDRRRRRGLRFRKLRRPRKIQSECGLLRARVQRTCLRDTTPRQCPVLGCRMIFYGIINYNDHLNLCHFTLRKHVCHYCHEGFEREADRFAHENEHIGISRLTVPGTWTRQRKASITQTDPEPPSDLPEEKLKKIVSFFDKISDPDQILAEMKKNRYSESNLQSCQEDATESAVSDRTDSDKRTVSCVNLPRKIRRAPPTDLACALACHYCGETFHYRRQLSLHVDLEHRVHDKFSKFHSCTGICNPHRHPTPSDDTKNPEPSQETLRRKSDETLSYEPSTNIVYYTSTESMAPAVPKVQGPVNYKWEPGTKIIRC